MTLSPTPLRSLLQDEAYKAYFRHMAPPFASSTPQFGIIVVTKEGKYGKTSRDTFKLAWGKAWSLLENPKVADVSIYTRNRIHPAPPIAAELCKPAEDWCGRCRRPSIFRVYGTSHPALRDAPVIVEGQRRCYFCGINYDMMRSKK